MICGVGQTVVLALQKLTYVICALLWPLPIGIPA